MKQSETWRPFRSEFIPVRPALVPRGCPSSTSSSGAVHSGQARGERLSFRSSSGELIEGPPSLVENRVPFGSEVVEPVRWCCAVLYRGSQAQGITTARLRLRSTTRCSCLGSTSRIILLNEPAVRHCSGLARSEPCIHHFQDAPFASSSVPRRPTAITSIAPVWRGPMKSSRECAASQQK